MLLNYFIEHIKRYTFLGILAIIPVSLSFFIVNYLYKNIDKQVNRLLPTISGYKVSWFEVFALFFILYLIGIVSSYLFGKRVTKMTKRIADLFPHVQDMNEELKIAQRVHQTIIPESISAEHFDIAVDYVPCNIIGGDFVQYHFRNDKTLIFVIGDVTGHGLPAALLTNRLHMEFDTQIQRGRQPGDLMRAANDFILRAFKGTNMYFSAFCGLIDIEKKELTYSSYGHIPQYVFRREQNEFIELTSHAPMLGVVKDESEAMMQSSQVLQYRDRIILFTDGIPETVGSRKERYGVDRLRQEIKDHANDTGSVFHKEFLEKLWQFTDQEYEDDVCLMTIDIK